MSASLSTASIHLNQKPTSSREVTSANPPMTKPGMKASVAFSVAFTSP